MKRGILEGDGKVLVVLFLTKVEFHAGINVTIMSTVFLHMICDELKRLAHAVLCHLLLGLVQFLKFLAQNREGMLENRRRVCVKGVSL